MPHQQGSNTDTVTQLDLQAMDPNQGGSSTYSSLNSGVPSTTGSTWTLQWPGNSSTENGAISNSSIHHGQQTEPLVRDGQGGQNAASQAIGSSSYGSSHGPQEHAGVASYSSSTDAYGYDTTGYQGYYYGYQQQTSNTYPQQVGVYQNSGAPYQPITSFQNSGSYSGSTSYSSTYYNTGDYQTTGSYPSGGTSNQATSWNDGSYASYPTHQYSNYNSSDSNGTHSSTTVAAAPLSYEQQYKQWADYYSHTASEISCAPGTENVSTAAGYPPPDNQPPPPGTTSWRKEQSSLESSSLQAGVLTGPGDTPNAYWGHGTPTLQNHHGSNPSSYSKASSYGQTPSYSQTPSQTQTPSYSQTPSQTQTPSYSQTQSQTNTPSYSQTQSQTNTPSYSQMPSQTQTPSYGHMPSSYNQTPTTFSQTPSQKSLQSNPVPYDFQNLPKAPCPQGSNLQYRPMHQIPQHYNPTVQPASSFDAQKVNKVQIPTNPRIASNLAFGLPIIEKDTPTTETAIKPAYVSVSMPNSDNKVLSRDASDSMLKPGMFPASLRAYVERALARCKNDLQKTACQTIMKEMITKASADGTLFTRNWDIEPLFPLPDMDTCIKESLQDSNTVCSLPKYKRSPSRRTKSRWEPLAEEKLVEKLASVNNSSWDNAKEREKTVSAGNYEGKVDGWSTSKFLQSQLQNQSKNSQRPFKKPRFSDINSVTENGDASSDSEKEQGLTAYYSGAVALANSPEERKRRESRSKRFEKGQGQRAEIKHFRPKAVGGGNVYTKRPTAMVIGKSYEDGGNRAVEDIDWDSLTVKGSCQEIEKRYLRLTSAPDPATVRPEEVLEKSLQMVRSSQKNYLYKCDQLKSIRQDLTVQRIRNELTVKVYETHARLALEAGDLPEYNQCASQLKILYGEGIKGCHMEFSAYNLLCVILHSNNSRDLVSSMARLSGETKNDEAVKHALAVRAAVTSGNYVLFFKLYKTAPNLNICLMDLHVEKMRFEAVKCMSRSYRPTVPLTFITQVLGFMDSLPSTERHNEKDTDAMEECEEWLRAHGACLIVDNSGDMLLDTKVSASTLFMPEPEDAVAHGDTNLAVNDFMTRTT